MLQIVFVFCDSLPVFCCYFCCFLCCYSCFLFLSNCCHWMPFKLLTAIYTFVWYCKHDFRPGKTITGSTFRATTTYRVSCRKVAATNLAALHANNLFWGKIICCLCFVCVDVLLYWSRYWRRRWSYDRSIQRSSRAWASAADQDPWCPRKICERCLHQRQPRECLGRARSWLGGMYSYAFYMFFLKSSLIFSFVNSDDNIFFDLFLLCSYV